MINYNEAFDIKRNSEKLASVLEMSHLKMDRIFYIRSHGSTSKGIIARCHALPRIMQKCLLVRPAYIIEVISENFDKLSEDERTKTLIHELLHIPKAFGGGFIHHNVVTRAKVERLYSKYRKLVQSATVINYDSDGRR